MSTAIKDKRKAIQKPARLSKPTKIQVQKVVDEEEVGLGALMGLHLPRSFQSPAEVDAYIRSLRDED